MKKKFFDKERKERARPKTKIIQSNTFYVTEKKIINLIRSIKTDCEKIEKFGKNHQNLIG